ncbi:hypothetical protein [Actinobacillus equuli]|uniref:hypothetical protein n=1 Tax=Actinobacillus equuli TaxID=718 RepID=UPI002442099C|nr:hypothetical protein [Actinobacillus equuli]WGE46644.1 hypothetical protein NYR84_00090 [Actinobacillus equuli subsp. haemolyticus]
MRDYLICILSFFLGILLWGYVIIFTHSSQYSINFGSLSDWLSALSTVGLLICAIKGFDSWKKQKKPEATIDLLKSIGNLEIKMDRESIFMLETLEKLNLQESSGQEIEKIKEKYMQSLNESWSEIEWSIRCYQIYHPDKEENIEKIHKKLLDIYCNYYDYTYFDGHFQKKLKAYCTFDNRNRKYLHESTKLKYATELFLKVSRRYTRLMVKEITGKSITLGTSAQQLKSKYNFQ